MNSDSYQQYLFICVYNQIKKFSALAVLDSREFFATKYM